MAQESTGAGLGHPCGWDPQRAEKNGNGEWEITLWVHI